MLASRNGARASEGSATSAADAEDYQSATSSATSPPFYAVAIAGAIEYRRRSRGSSLPARRLARA